jgi:hypothetical protein
MRNAFLFLTIAALTSISQAQTTAKPQILVLGTYHMANPGHDISNMKADDVLSPKRQQQIAQLMEVLKKFHPTKIAVEADVGSKRVPQEYADYLAGKYTLTRNEIDQIGYRLAKELGQTQIYPVDADGDFPWQHLVNYAKANGLSDKVDAMLASSSARVKAEGDFLQSHSVLEMLERMNSDAEVAQDVAWYYQAARLGDPYDEAGPDLLADWFQRNIRIYNNVTKLIDSPNERILVIFGAGHLGWLRQDFGNDPSLELRRLGDFVSR